MASSLRNSMIRRHVRLDDQPVLDEAAVVATLRSVQQVEELTDEGGELVLDTLVFQFDLVGGSDGRLRWLTGEMYYDHMLAEEDLRTAFGILTDLAESVGATLYEANEECSVMTPEYVERTIRQNLGQDVGDADAAAFSAGPVTKDLPRLRP